MCARYGAREGKEAKVETNEALGVVLAGNKGLLSVAEMSRILRASRMIRLDQGDTLISIGEIPSAVCFLISGVLRSYLLDAAGRDVTDCLMAEPGEAAMPQASIDTRSAECVEALAPTELLAIDRACIQELLETSLEVNRFYNWLLMEGWQRHWDVKRVVCQCRARERYLWFLDQYPGLIDAIPNRYIASFLGMTPVTLSRLRTSLKGAQPDASGKARDADA